MHVYAKYDLIISPRLHSLINDMLIQYCWSGSRTIIHYLAWRTCRSKRLIINISAWSRRPSKPFWQTSFHAPSLGETSLSIAFPMRLQVNVLRNIMFQGSCTSHTNECRTPSCVVGFMRVQKKDKKEQKLGEKNNIGGRHFGSVLNYCCA